MLFYHQFQAEVQQAQDALNKHKETLKLYNKDIAQKESEKKDLNRESNECGLKIQELEHKITKFQKDSKDASKYVCFILKLAI